MNRLSLLATCSVIIAPVTARDLPGTPMRQLTPTTRKSPKPMVGKKQQASIKRKLFTFLTLMGLACTGMIFTSHTLLIDYIHDELHREQLEAAANRLADQLKASGGSATAAIQSDFFLSQYSFHVEDDQGNAFTSDAFTPGIDILKRTREPGVFHITGDGLSKLGYSKTYFQDGKKIDVTIIERNAYSMATLDRVHVLIWAMSFAFLFTISVVIFFSVTIALKPLKKMSGQLTALKHGDLKRLDEDVPEEFSDLVKHLNRLLESYEKKLTRSRHLAADISHSLKTPLAVINSIISDEAIPAKSVEQLKHQLSEIRELIDTQMRKTEISGQHTGKTTPVIEKTLALIDVVSRIYPYKEIHLEEALPRELAWPIDERDYNEILGNVLDNAGKWCTSEVYLHLKIDNDILTILIEDDGPGVAPHQLSDLTKRQKRLDEKTPGYGLGLSIVEEIVNDYAGAMYFSASPAGGLRVLIELPRSI